MAELALKVIVERMPASSCCRLCEQRNALLEPLIHVQLIQEKYGMLYCIPCYEWLRQAAAEHINFPAAPESILTQLHLEVPTYLVKEREALRLFYPTDGEELDRYRRKAAERKKT